MKKAINGKRRALRLGTGIATCVSSIVLAHSAFGQSLPEIASAGGANISTTGNTMTIDALAADKVINWGTFSVAQNNNVNFVSTDGVGGAVATPVTVINRVIGKDVGGTNTFFPSIIDGRLTSTSNIAVWLINPSGVMFGPTGSFNGGSLVVSTLDFASGTGSQVFGAGNKISSLKARDVVPGAVELKLEGGAGAAGIVSSGSVLLLGEQVTVGKTVLASAGDVYIVAASDVRITSQAGSPIGYNFAAGTRLNGAQVLASGNVQGRNIVVAASNGTSTIANLLQVDLGSQLTATADGGAITLLTAANPIAPATAAGANIVSAGNLRTTGLNGDILVTSNANVAVGRLDATGDATIRSGIGASDSLSAGTVRAGGQVDLRSTGDMTLGLGAADVIQASGKVSIRSGGTIARGGAAGSALTIRSHVDPLLAPVDGAMLIQSVGDANLGSATLVAGSAGTAPITVFSNAGGITIGTAVASRFAANALTTFDSTGSITADNSLVGPGAALSISAPDGITLGSARTTGVDQDISLNTVGELDVGTVIASRNLSIGNSLNPALSINAEALTAQSGTISAIADDITIGTATAGLSINLRSDGDVEVTTAGTSGNALPSGNFNVSGLTGARAASFTGGAINAKTGLVGISADVQTVDSVRTFANATLTGTADITLGSADIGGNLQVTTAGNITLGTLNSQSIVADGRVTITSTNGAIGRGADSTGLTIRSNDGDVAPADALAIKGQNAVALGNAALFGGISSSAAVSVESVTAGVGLGTVRGSAFTGKAATTFTATGSILADSATALAGNTISITGLTGLDLQTVRTGGAGENIVLTSNGPISATTLAARNNLTVASLGNPAASLTASSMTAQLGSVSAFAQAMTLGTANAAQALTLRSNGAITLTGSAIAGTNLSVAGITLPRAASFQANLAQATAGNVDIKAVTTNINTATAGQNVVIDGTDVTLGRITAGTGAGSGSYTVTATGAVVLGKTAGQTQTARGGITISGASIREGATGLTLTSDSDGNGSSALALTATTGAITLASATLNGGPAKQSAVTLSSATDTTIKAANGLSFTATTGAAGAFSADTLAVGNGATSITAGTAASIGSVTAGGNYTMLAGGDVTLGKAPFQTQAAAGAISITSTGGSIVRGAAATGLTLTANSDGAGGGDMLLDAKGAAGAITLDGATLNGGTAAQRTAMTLKSVTDTVLANANAAAFTATARDFTSSGSIVAAGDAAITATGAASINAIETTGAGSDIAITAGSALIGTAKSAGNYAVTTAGAGGVTLGKSAGQTHSAAGAITITADGGSIVRGAAATGLTLTANSDGAGGGDMLLDAKGAAGAITLDGATLNGGTAAQRTAMTLKSVTDTVLANANAAAFTATARDFTSSGSIMAAGDAAITATGAASINAIETTGAGSNIAITAGSALIGTARSAGDYAVTTTGAGGVTLSKSAGQTHSAAGAISITANGGSIMRGADAASLILAANSDGADGGALALSADGAIALGGATINGGTVAERTAVTLTAGTDISFANANSAGFTAASTVGNFTSTGNITAAGAASLTTGNAATINQISTTGAGNGITVRATSASLGRVTSAGDYTVTTTTGNITLGNGAGQTQSAAGSIKITSGEGAINQGAAGLTLLSNASGTGTGTLELTSRTGIGLQGATLNGGPDQQSDVSLLTNGEVRLAKVASANFTSSSGGSFAITGAVEAKGNVSIGSSGSIELTKVTAEGSDHDITLFAQQTVSADSLTAARNVTVNGPILGSAGKFTASSVTAGTGSVNVAAGQTDIGTVTAGLDVIVGGVSASLGNVAAGRDYLVDVKGDLTLGKAGLRVQSAGGKVQLTSSGGTIVEGVSGLTLTGNSDGALGETVGLSATQIALGSSTINGGPDRQSLVSVESTGATTVGKVNAVTFAGNGLESFTATGAITTTNVASILSNGPIALTSVTATSQPFGSVKINTPGSVTADSILAGQTIEIGGFFDSPVASAIVNTLEATTGSVLVRAGSSDIGSIKSGLDTRVLGSTATIGSVTAGGSYTVVADGNLTLGKAQGQLQKAAKGISITSTGGSISQGAAGLTLTSDSDGSGGDALTLAATTGAIALANATLNGGPARQSAITLGSGTTTVIGAANGRAFTATGKGFTANREISSATDIAITVDGPVSLVQGANAVGAVRLSATDAVIGGTVDARTIDVTNSGSGNLVIGGAAASETGKFVLSRTEAGLLKATETLTLGADGSDNVEIRQVDFAVPKTVRVLANGKRIDITGRISFGSATTLKLGGSTAANSIIRLQTGTGNSGGAMVSNGGVLELTAASIVGGTAAFANDLGAVSGSGSVADATRLNLNPGSSLYNNIGGTGSEMIDVGSMKVTFSNFATFQNTSDASLSLLSTGVKLGNGNPQAIALDIQSGSTQPVFAVFGSINGIVNAATALLGNPPLSHYDNISASRINGCVIGGGNCQSVQNLTPSLTALDNIRTSIFTVKPDFQVPFDPLVGTNNDALFDDVGSFGLGELPMTPIECSDPNGTCEVQKKGGN